MNVILNKTKPLVSVWMLTYNHEDFIRQSLESVMMQKTNFPIEVIIGEDCSTDNTRAIVKELEKKYPDIIKPIYHDVNFGVGRNSFEFCFPRLRGKYAAVLEGDDYWTDPLKLQKQVDFLEANQQYSMCFHNAVIKYDDGSVEDKLFCNGLKNKQVFTISDVILKNWFCPSGSMVFRNEEIIMPDWAQSIYNGDLLMQLLLSSNGDIVYLDEIMTVYRQNAGNLTARKKSVTFYNNRIINLLRKFNKHSGYKYVGDINKRIGQLRIKNLKSIILSLLSKVNQFTTKLKPARK